MIAMDGVEEALYEITSSSSLATGRLRYKGLLKNTAQALALFALAKTNKTFARGLLLRAPN